MPDEDYGSQIAIMREFFASGATLDISFRRHCLLALHAEIRKNENIIFKALHADLGKCAAEAYMTEVGLCIASTRHLAKKVAAWSKARLAWPDMSLFPALARVCPQPFGLVLVFSPWNYPFQLSLIPLAEAICAGNCVVLKPSRQAPRTAQILRQLVAAVFEKKHCQVILDAPETAGEDAEETANALLQEKFDFIFYTGSARVGHIIMEAASRHLTPVCLELGGQSPVFVAKDAILHVAAKRIAWGKLLNAGQTCVAPDYIYAENSIKEELMELLWEQFTAMLGDNPLANPDYARIVSAKAFTRLVNLAQSCGVSIDTDEKNMRIAPIVFAATEKSPALNEEIFGPLLPVLGFDNIDDAISNVKTRPRPLACYIFTTSQETARHIIEAVPYGGGCVNDVALQAASHNLPFGGIGMSGMGRYHGKAGFDLFSNMKGIVSQWPKFDLPLRYPPYSSGRLNLLRKLLR